MSGWARRTPDATIVVAIAVVALALGAVAQPVCPATFDCESYLAMAAHPSVAPRLLPHHAGRILPPVVAHALSVVGLREFAAFRVLAVLGYFAVGVATFLALRRSGPVLAAAAMTAWLWFVPEPFLTCLLDVAQAGYLWTFSALVAMAWLSRSERPGAAILVGLAASLCRQELLIATVLAAADSWWRRRTWKVAAQVVAAVTVFWGVQRIVAPTSDGMLERAWSALSWAAISEVWTHPTMIALVWMFFPFTVAVAPRLWRRPFWLCAYALAVLGLDTFLAGLVGAGDFARVALLGLWPLAWRTGEEVVRSRAPRWTWLVGAALALGFVVRRRASALLGLPPQAAHAYALAAPTLFFVAWVLGVRARARERAKVTAAPAPAADELSPGAPPVEEPRRSLVHKTSWSAIGTATSSIGAAATGVLVYRILPPDQAGRFAYATWFASIGVAVLGLGIAPAVTRYVAAARGTGIPADGLARWLTRAGLLVTVLSLPVFAAAWLLLSRGSRSSVPVAPVAAFFAAQSAAALATAFLSGGERFRRLAALNVVAAVASVAAVSLGAWRGGVVGALVGSVLATLPLMVAALRLGATPGAFRAGDALVGSIRRYAAASWTSSVVTAIVWSRAELFFLERSAGNTAVAMFGVGAYVAQIAAQGPLLLVGALVPHFTRQATSGSRAELAETYASTARVLALAVLPVCAWIAVLVPRVVPIVFGAAYARAVPVSVALVAAAPIGVIGAAASSVVLALGRSRFIAVSGLLTAAAACALYATLIPAYGTMGAAGGRIAIHLGAAAWGLSYMAIRLEVRTPVRDLVRIGVAAAASAAVGALVLKAAAGYATLTAATVVMAPAYLVALRAIGALDRAEARKLIAAIDELPRWLATPGRAAIRLASAAGTPKRRAQVDS